MALTKLSVDRAVTVAFSDRQDVIFTEASVLLLRNGADLEAALTTRGKLPGDLTFSLSRTPFGDVGVTVTKKGR